jgi:hypothetical protein
MTDQPTQPVEDYRYEDLRNLQQEESAALALEGALTVALVATVLGATGGAAPVGVPWVPPRLSLDAFATALTPIILPSAIASIGNMLNRAGAPTNALPQAPIEVAQDVVDGAIKDLHDAVEATRTRVTEQSRTTTGPREGDETEEAMKALRSWANTVARIIVTHVNETIKARTAADLGLTHKRWLTKLDSRVRPTHAKLEGVSVTADDVFTIPDEGGLITLRWPGDSRAPISVTINCRCKLLWY